jgi:hypothetical protein
MINLSESLIVESLYIMINLSESLIVFDVQIAKTTECEKLTFKL